jgi:hypothetical protein
MPKISELSDYTNPLPDDVLPIVDVSARVTKKVTQRDLIKNALNRANHIGTQTPDTISPQGDGSNLDADKLDGQDGSYYLDRANHTGTQAPSTISPQGSGSGLDADMVDSYHAGNSSGQVAVSNGDVCTDLNADMIDGYHAGNGSGQVAVSNGNVCTNLNADMVDGLHASELTGVDMSTIIAMSFFFGG